VFNLIKKLLILTTIIFFSACGGGDSAPTNIPVATPTETTPPVTQTTPPSDTTQGTSSVVIKSVMRGTETAADKLYTTPNNPYNFSKILIPS